MTAREVISSIETGGGAISLAPDGEKLHVRVSREKAERLKPQLKALKSEIIALLRHRSVVYLDMPCICDEKTYPHFRHHDGTGPGSGHLLNPFNPEQAHRRRR